MNPRDQRVAIAETCGVQTIYWKARYDNHGAPDFHIADSKEEAEEWPFKDLGVESFVHFGKIPDYTNDLNAMHEAEKHLVSLKLPTIAMACYNGWLNYLICGKAQQEMDTTGTFSLLTATSAQRAEAFLRALSLWVETSDD